MTAEESDQEKSRTKERFWVRETRETPTLEETIAEYRKYSGAPRCMDCKWKLHTDITDNCGCMFLNGEPTQEQQAKHLKTFNRARKLQEYLTREGIDILKLY